MAHLNANLQMMWQFGTGKSYRVGFENHGEEIANCRPYLLGSYDRPPRNLAFLINSGYKAKEWQGYFYGLAPPLLYGILPNKYWQTCVTWCNTIRIITQHAIHSTQLQGAQLCLDELQLEFEILYVRRRDDCLHFVQPLSSCATSYWPGGTTTGTAEFILYMGY